MNNNIQFLLYSMPDDKGKIQVVIKDETLWCTQRAMAELFGVGVPAISKHLNNIYEDKELQKEATVSKMEIVQVEGTREVKRTSEFYNLDAIIAVGYRVSSFKATRFRQWATKVLHEYIQKGFAMDDERLKQAKTAFSKDYFRELLERVRSIRAIWQQITDIYAECAFDYDSKSPTTREFFQMVQNRFHYAITGQTAPEIIYSRADHTKDHMGLTTWENAPDGKILKADVTIAKNYLSKEEMNYLERIVSLYLDYAELQAERKIPMSMEDWAKRLDGFLEFNGNELLTGPSKISAEQAKLHAETEYEKYRVIQDRLYESDFDRFLMLEQEVNHKDEV